MRKKEKSGAKQQAIEDAKTINAAQGTNENSINRCQLKFLMPKEKDVELVREDGSREVHKLVK